MPASTDAPVASARWGTRTLAVALDVNVRQTFGSAAFFVAEDSGRVVSLDAHGRPLAPLDPSTTYVVHSGGSRELRRQAGALAGQMSAARDDLDKLRHRVAKLGTCFQEEFEQLRTMLARGAAPHAEPTAQGEVTARREPTENERSAVDGPLSPAAPSTPTEPSAAADASSPCAGWRPVGRIRSPFVEKNGTPRQGIVCPSARALLDVDLRPHGLHAAHALDGLSHFSHVWLLFVFDRDSPATKSKVHPPRLDGLKVGLFATRSPHRPNNLGLSLVRLERVDGHTLTLTGVDLVDGTPILDIKPYVPFADGAALSSVTVAPWLDSLPTPELDVVWTDEATRQLAALEPELRLLRTAEQARAAVSEVLGADPRSVHWRGSRAALEYGFSLDTLNVVSSFEGGVARILRVDHVHLSDRSHLNTAHGP